MRHLPFQDAVTLVKGHLDIVELISRYVPLKRAGRNYLGLCPFHPDKHPSMNVSREKGLFKCFSCGEGGDALAFLMKIERKPFGEVIRELAEAQGVAIEQDGVSAQEAERRRDVSQQLLVLNQEAQAYFVARLNEDIGADARAYCAQRDLPDAIIQRFGLGLAPPGWENLTRRLLATQAFVRSNPDVLVTAGLASPRQADSQADNKGASAVSGAGGYYDRFRNRLTLPIHDDTGRIVAFGARALAPEDKPKYLNSPETPLYQKSRLLYGLFAARDTIRQQRAAILMEGYFDVIRAHQHGLTQAIGVCGTALTDSHVKLLLRLGVETLYLAFDADEAGQKAALSAIATIEALPAASDLSVRVVPIPQGKDPDDFLASHGEQGQAAFEALLHTAPRALDFQCLRAIAGFNPMEVEDRIKAAARLTPVLAAVRLPVTRQEYIARYADRIGVRAEDLALEIRRWLRLHARDTQASHAAGHAFGGPADGAHPDTTSTKQFVSGGAISQRQRRFHNRTGVASAFSPPPSVRPRPRHLAAERALLSLWLIRPESYKMIRSIVESHPFEDNTLQSLARVLQSVTIGGDESGETAETTMNRLIQAVNEQLGEQPALQGAFADVAFHADILAEQLGLASLSAAEGLQAIQAEAATYQAALNEHRQCQALRALADETRTLEGEARQTPDASEMPLLKTVYDFRDQVTRVKHPVSRHQEI